MRQRIHRTMWVIVGVWGYMYVYICVWQTSERIIEFLIDGTCASEHSYSTVDTIIIAINACRKEFAYSLQTPFLISMSILDIYYLNLKHGGQLVKEIISTNSINKITSKTYYRTNNWIIFVVWKSNQRL